MDVGRNLYVGECVFYFLFECSPICFSVVCVCVSVLCELVVCLCVICNENGKVI